ncbi:hypothetical protein DUNSADRAFT_7028 [Dunaliella salina]|uniref:Uncharacterized protein n=1 Tax=Dunaliella salina TaxID=3046 RepID=A0ABQ7GM28_DUNSA|nr:hypothetical protein DUNSADRAFT_7028 [Dunaliella salina]|eukprot:KAF5835669.1 hypothetical protein DUNSADRAFT_7028 [Dunaliella salina]
MDLRAPAVSNTLHTSAITIRLFLQGLSEPLGALLALLVLHPFITPERLQYLLAAVGGLMLAVCIFVLWPGCRPCQHTGWFVLGLIDACLCAWLQLAVYIIVLWPGCGLCKHTKRVVLNFNLCL